MSEVPAAEAFGRFSAATPVASGAVALLSRIRPLTCVRGRAELGVVIPAGDVDRVRCTRGERVPAEADIFARIAGGEPTCTSPGSGSR